MTGTRIRTFIAQRLSREIKDRWHAHLDRGCDILGYDRTYWIRKVQVDDWTAFLATHCSATAQLLEISPGRETAWRRLAGANYRSVDFPGFDICAETLPERFDVIIADEVFEHLPDAEAAARNIRSMIRDDGVFLIATPFLVALHGAPDYGDYQRWTPDGLRLFLKRCGFSRVEVKSWGNRKAARANFRRWAAYGWGRDLRDEPRFPLTVWAYARP